MSAWTRRLAATVALALAGSISYMPTSFAQTPPGPTTTAVSPSSGIAGTVVTITGTGLTGTTAVQFGAQAAIPFTVNSDTQIIAISPPSPIGTVDITVTTPLGTSPTNIADRFTNVFGPPGSPVGTYAATVTCGCGTFTHTWTISSHDASTGNVSGTGTNPQATITGVVNENISPATVSLRMTYQDGSGYVAT